jgi:hypothetical protein
MTMNKLIIAVAISLIAGQAIAAGNPGVGNNGNDKPVGNAGNNGKHYGHNKKGGSATSGSSSSSGATAAAGAIAGSSSFSDATGGTASALGGSASGGTAIASIAPMNFSFTVPAASGTSTSFVQHDYSGMPQQAPAMGNSYISTSNTCDGAQGLGVVFPGGGVNFSSTALRMMCEGRLNSQAHKALGDEDKARKVMRVVDEYACTQDATWAKIAREEGLCKPDTTPAATGANPVFSSAG